MANKIPDLEPKGVRRFRIYFGKGKERRWYMVYIFDRLRHMEPWVNTIAKAFGDPPVDNFGAITIPLSVQRKNGSWSPQIGIIAFCEEYLFNYVIAHEMAHASTLWFVIRHHETDLMDHPANERFAWALGEAYKQMMEKLNRKP